LGKVGHSIKLFARGQCQSVRAFLSLSSPIELYGDDARVSETAETDAMESDQPYWQDEMDDMLDDYD
jgi:hypothetical protein